MIRKSTLGLTRAAEVLAAGKRVGFAGSIEIAQGTFETIVVEASAADRSELIHWRLRNLIAMRRVAWA